MNKDMENKEWLNDYMSLKQVNPNNPFTVPSGYFSEMEQQILSRIKLDELKQNDPGFTVPENYFEELGNNIQSRINIETALNNETGFAIPAGYFDNLEQQIKSRVFIEEALNTGADTGAESLTVPPNYFNELNQNILSKTINQDKVKRTGIVRRMFVSGAFKYAAVACFTLIVGASIFFNQFTDPAASHNDSYLHKSLLTVPVDEIQSYLQLNLDATDTQHTLVSEGTTIDNTNLNNALQDYIDTDQ